MMSQLDHSNKIGDISGNQRSSLLTRLMRVGWGAVMATSMVGCASRYSTEALHALAPNAGIIDTCVRFPIADPEATVVAYDSKTRTAVSDGDWAKFARFAKTKADFIYRYDSTMPDETTSMLPLPYKGMVCRPQASSQPLPLPKGMAPMTISLSMREALAGVLLALNVEEGNKLNTHAVI